MPSIIFKIIKESAIILATLLLCNLVLNNNYVRPTLDILNNQKEVASDTSWHIYKREHKLVLGISGHHFIELRDSDNNVISQIHGKAYDNITKEIVEVAKSFRKNYKLKVIEYNGDKYSDINLNIGDVGIELAKGSEEDMKLSWTKAEGCGKIINSKDIDYPKFGFRLINETENSNSVAHTLINCMGYTDKNIGLFNPGEKSLLIEGQ